MTEHDISRHLSHEHQILQEIDQNLSAEHPDVIVDELLEARDATEQRIGELAIRRLAFGLEIPPHGQPLDAPQRPSSEILDMSNHPQLFNEKELTSWQES